MPVTAKLSSRFYEKLGDDVTNELVTWLNAVDAEFRNDLREANDHLGNDRADHRRPEAPLNRARTLPRESR
ncbi:MAG: hypothetical protein NUW01_11870 [Gemmatimonadaceae bacterium]|nr:hypothetical protein [Gemmatimonadaceae bacterium]